MNELEKRYLSVKEEYKKIGVDTDEALKKLSEVRISMHCWQADDVRGFMGAEELTGGIQATGNYPGRARNVEEAKQDYDEVLSLVPGKFNLNLHAIYPDTNEKVDLDELEPKHFAKWVEYAKSRNIGLDFNPTLFSHPKASTGFTLSSNDENIRNFWIEHCKRCRKIGEYFGKETGVPCVTNIWIADGYKDVPYDRLAPRIRLKESLDEILKEKIDPKYNIDSVESKVFGIGVESYTVGSNEFYLSYAVKNNMCVTYDSGHFHPTEYISDKLSTITQFVPHILLHVSRPVRWDSDHVVIFDDELNEIARTLVRNDLLKKTSIGLDYFDASINRISAYVVGIRSTQKALLRAMLEPKELLEKVENDGNYTDRMFITERLKTMDFGTVYDYFCYKNGKKIGMDVLDQIHRYEKEVLLKRD